MLKGKGYQGSAVSKIFKRITKNYTLSQSQKRSIATTIYEEENTINKTLVYVKKDNEKLRRGLRSHNIRFIFYTKKSFNSPLSKRKD